MDKPKDERASQEAKKAESPGPSGERLPGADPVAAAPEAPAKPITLAEAPETKLSYSPAELSAEAGAKSEVSPAAVKTSPPPAELFIEKTIEEQGAQVRAVYEHPWVIRFCHWLNAVSLFIMIGTGLRIFKAFPSFGPRVPRIDLVNIPKALTLGGWLGGALRWHFTFMWIFVGTGMLYLAYQFLSGHYKTVLFVPKDIPGVWPMACHYFLFGPKPAVTGQYNPLQKLAYTSTVLFGIVSVMTGVAIYKPIQFSWLAWLMGGFHYARGWHFAAMCGFLAFIPGHLLMVALHGWSNFYAMLTGWKKNPEYIAQLHGDFRPSVLPQTSELRK